MNKKKLLIENIFFVFAMINLFIFIIHYILLENNNNYIQIYNKKNNIIMNTNNNTNKNKEKKLFNFFDKDIKKNKSVYYLYSIQLNDKSENDSIIDDNEKYIDKNIQKIINYLIALLFLNFGFIMMLILKILMNYIKIKKIKTSHYLPIYVKPLLIIFSFCILVGSIVCFIFEKNNSNIKKFKNNIVIYFGLLNIIFSFINPMKFGIKKCCKFFKYNKIN